MDTLTPNERAALFFSDTETWKDERGYDLSQRLWRNGQAARRQIDAVLRDAIRTGRSIEDTATELEQYLDPAFQTAGKAHYPATRLAGNETRRAHARGEHAVAMTDPAGGYLRYQTSAGHIDQDECDDAATHDEGYGRGVYPARDCPLPPKHVGCRCFVSRIQTAAIGMDDFVEQLRVDYDLADPTDLSPADLAEFRRLTQPIRDQVQFMFRAYFEQTGLVTTEQLVDDIPTVAAWIRNVRAARLTGRAGPSVYQRSGRDVMKRAKPAPRAGDWRDEARGILSKGNLSEADYRRAGSLIRKNGLGYDDATQARLAKDAKRLSAREQAAYKRYSDSGFTDTDAFNEYNTARRDLRHTQLQQTAFHDPEYRRLQGRFIDADYEVDALQHRHSLLFDEPGSGPGTPTFKASKTRLDEASSARTAANADVLAYEERNLQMYGSRSSLGSRVTDEINQVNRLGSTRTPQYVDDYANVPSNLKDNQYVDYQRQVMTARDKERFQTMNQYFPADAWDTAIAGDPLHVRSISPTGRAYHIPKQTGYLPDDTQISLREITFRNADDIEEVNKVLLHETSHMIEQQNPYIHDAVQEFYDRRTAGQPLQDLPWGGGEQYRDGGFFTPYVGKDVPGDNSEVFSMGMDEMFFSGNGGSQIFTDPEHADLIIGLLTKGRP